MPSRARLTFLALCALEDAAEEAKRGKVEPTPALRLALGFLCAVSKGDGGPTSMYASFWDEAVLRGDCGDHPGAVGRFQMLNACMNGIAAAAGRERDSALMAAARRDREKRARKPVESLGEP